VDRHERSRDQILNTHYNASVNLRTSFQPRLYSMIATKLEHDQDWNFHYMLSEVLTTIYIFSKKKKI